MSTDTAIVSKSVKSLGKIGKAEMHVEEIEKMTLHKRRGRKPKSK